LDLVTICLIVGATAIIGIVLFLYWLLHDNEALNEMKTQTKEELFWREQLVRFTCPHCGQPIRLRDIMEDRDFPDSLFPSVITCRNCGKSISSEHTEAQKEYLRKLWTKF
jgi:predicted RNA-binding Zn-ribbon protein involved in translation (DUF1610 family)